MDTFDPTGENSDNTQSKGLQGVNGGERHRRRRRRGRGQDSNGRPPQDARGSTRNNGRGPHPRADQQRPPKDHQRRDDRTRDGRKPREAEIVEAPFVHIAKRYGVVFFDSLMAAKADLANVKTTATQFDQLNVVIRAEANMDDPDLLAVGNVKVFAGAAWTLIHERRQQDGWYNQPQ